MAQRIEATYHYRATAGQAEARAEGIALEQSVELPLAAIPPRIVEAGIVGKVEAVRQVAESLFETDISYPLANTGHTAAQLLNVLFGNTSLHGEVALLDARLPDVLLASFRGPRHGIGGLRRLTDVHGRPLTATALKPIGSSIDELAALCESFAHAGIDLIKDDHGIADQAYAPFAERVRACQAAIERAAQATGRRSIYVPNLSGAPTALNAQVELARAAGIRAVMASPMLIGAPTFEELVQHAEEIAVIAHPALGGAQRIAPAFLFGRLFRLLGADAVIFVNYGGRFGYAESECRLLADNLRQPWGSLLGALPMPAGGMTVDRLGDMVDTYGSEVILLISGALYGPEGAIERESRRFVDAVRQLAAAA